MEFRNLGISQDLALRLEKLGFKNTFEVQEKTIPDALKGIDLAVRAKTGSGKTLAFGIPLADMLKSNGKIQAMILAPTRELAVQTYEVMIKLSRLKIALIYGGVSYNRQFEDLKTADVVIGTPGRIMDHMNRGTLRAEPEYLVLDEADRMLDMGFAPDIMKIMRRCPPKKIWLFSATLDNSIMNILKGRNFRTIFVGEEMPKLDHLYIEAPNKISKLKEILNGEKTLIFCNTKTMTQRLGEILRAPAIHGDMSQAARERSLDKFKEGEKYLVATDVAARGLDIPEVGMIVNFDVPKDRTAYIHRSGRTGRAGKTGKVLTLLRADDHDAFRRLINETNLDFNRLD
jgi:ATP-dependent RNA helicase DeaD